MLVIVFLVLILANNPLIHSNPFKGAYADTSIKAIGTFEIKTSFQDTDLYSINTGYGIMKQISSKNLIFGAWIYLDLLILAILSNCI